jgi:hypothetical protein
MALTLNPKLWTYEPPAGFANGQGGLAEFLRPGQNGGYIDVVSNYKWTLSRLGAIERKEVPSINLREYRVLKSSLRNSAEYYAVGAGTAIGAVSPLAGNSNNPYLQYMAGYKGLFDFENETGFSYRLPYFSDINTEVQSTWTTLDILEKIKGAADIFGAGALIETAGGVGRFALETQYPRVGIMDRPKIWEQSSPRSITIKFPLFNTEEEDDIQNNWELCYLLTHQNLFNKRDFVTGIPPVFYTVYAPGQYYSLAAYVSDLKIYNRGHIHRIPFQTKVRNIPDAFEVEMTLTDMVMPSQNMHAILQREQPVKVTDADGNVLI